VGFIEMPYSRDLITVEIKLGSPTLSDIYQAKLYKEVFEAKCGFLITGSAIQEELRRLCETNFLILGSAVYTTFLAIGRFDMDSGSFTEWWPTDPFQQGHFWNP